MNQYEAAGITTINDIRADPANDNFRFFGDQESIDRAEETSQPMRIYEKFNNQEGNSAINGADNLPDLGGRLQSSTNLPDSEDLNRDNTCLLYTSDAADE